jgi:repressor LexA
MMKRKKLPERQKLTYDFVKHFIHKNGFPPTMREIGEGIGVKTTSLVSYYLTRLEELGYIAREPSVSRGIRLVEADGTPIIPQLAEDTAGTEAETVSLPFLGYIVASAPIPIEALPGTETIEINRALFGSEAAKMFALEVQGDSMIDALINDGDIVILRQQERVENGEMAAVWLTHEAGETTLKKVYHEGKRVRLQPANPTMDPIYAPADAVQIQGKVVLVIRQLE